MLKKRRLWFDLVSVWCVMDLGECFVCVCGGWIMMWDVIYV